MDNHQITKAEIITYLSNSRNIEVDRKIESWMSIDDKNNSSLTEIIDIIWKIIV